MYTLVRSLPVRQLLLREGPVLLLSIIVAELFYKFHSFTLECVAFLATWFVLDLAARTVAAGFARLTEGSPRAPNG